MEGKFLTIKLQDPLEKQIKLKNEIDKVKESTKPKNLDKNEKKSLTFENAYKILGGKQKVFNGFESEIFSIKKQTQGKEHPLDLAHVPQVAMVIKQNVYYIYVLILKAAKLLILIDYSQSYRSNKLKKK